MTAKIAHMLLDMAREGYDIPSGVVNAALVVTGDIA